MRIIAVTSGKGGVGKSTFTLNMAVALAAKRRRVLVFDGDLGLANIDILSGVTPSFTLQHVVAGHKTLLEVIENGPGGIGIIGGGSAIHNLMHAGKKRLASFFSQFDALSDTVDYMLIDTSAGIENRVFEFLGIANDIVVVSNSEPTSITDSYAVVKVCTKKQVAAPLHIVSNSIRRPEEGPAIFNALAQVSQVFLDVDLLYLGAIQYDPMVNDSIRKQKPVLLAHPKSPAATDIAALADRVLTWKPIEKPQKLEDQVIQLYPDVDESVA